MMEKSVAFTTTAFFAVVVQPFFSKAKADDFPVEFLSNVRLGIYNNIYPCTAGTS